MPFQLTQHHLYCMLENMELKKSLLKMMNLKNYISLIDWFDKTFEFKRYGEDGFGMGVEIPYKANSCVQRSASVVERQE